MEIYPFFFSFFSFLFCLAAFLFLTVHSLISHFAGVVKSYEEKTPDTSIKALPSFPHNMKNTPLKLYESN